MNTDLLHNFFAGKASNEEILEIKNWTEASEENFKEFIIERKIYDSIQLNASILDKPQDNKKPRRVFSIRKGVRELLKIASIAIISLFVSWILLGQNKIDANPLAMQTITVPVGQRVNLVLPDGTNVWLNSKSTLQYPIAFNSKERNVHLEGQAYFDVAKNEKIPFIVSTHKGSVKALGTAFDIISSSREDVFETMLLEGSVEVKLSNNTDQKLILEPNMKATVVNNFLNATYVEDQNPYEWRNGLISFRDKKFRDIMAILEKTYDIEVVLSNPSIGDQTYTGKFRISDGVQYALDVLALYKNFDYKLDYENHKIYIK